MKIDYGYLLKKRNINYQNKEYTVFEFLDIVAGIGFYNSNKGYRHQILTGNYADVYANDFTNKNIVDYMFFGADLKKEIENKNDNIVDFPLLREKVMSQIPKYYKQADDVLTSLQDQDLINLLDNEKHKEDFDEHEFKNKTDISTMYNTIKKTIISQDEQIMKILTALFKNQKVVNSKFDNEMISKLKENIIIYGSTGTGKTAIIKKIAKIYNVPIVIEDATSLSETGYQGRKVSDMLENLLLAANNDIELAEKGILVIDEFDKLAEKDSSKNHVSREGVQRALLKILDGDIIYFDNKKFDTSRLTIIGLGAFTGITKGDNYQDLNIDDFMNYGIMREVIARFSKTIPMNPLLKSDIEKILLNSDFSPLETYKKLFEEMEIKFDYDKEFVSWIAEEAIKKNSGARSLKTVFDNCISSAMFRIFAGEYDAISMIKPEPPENKPYILTKKQSKGLFKRKKDHQKF